MAEHRGWTLLTAGACGLAFAANSVFGQTNPCRGCERDSTATKSHMFPAVGIRAGAPQKVSFAVGVVTGVDWQKRGTDYSRDVAFFIEPGVGASRASVAYITPMGNLGSGFGVAVSAMRTSGSPWTFSPNTTYIGGELLVWPIFLAGPRLGLFRRMSGDATMGHWFVGADFGFGL